MFERATTVLAHCRPATSAGSSRPYARWQAGQLQLDANRNGTTPSTSPVTYWRSGRGFEFIGLDGDHRLYGPPALAPDGDLTGSDLDPTSSYVMELRTAHGDQSCSVERDIWATFLVEAVDKR
jgi:hypothetical protein